MSKVTSRQMPDKYGAMFARRWPRPGQGFRQRPRRHRWQLQRQDVRRGYDPQVVAL